jgi:hypothetical protein
MARERMTDTESLTQDSCELLPAPLDGWLVPPHTASRRSRGRGRDRRGNAMTQPLVDLVEQFCQYQLKQRGKTEGGVQSYRWVLEQFLMFVKSQQGRVVRVTDLTQSSIQLWMDEMASDDLAMSTMRSRQSALSSFCAWRAAGESRRGDGPATASNRTPAAGAHTSPHGCADCCGPATSATT